MLSPVSHNELYYATSNEDGMSNVTWRDPVTGVTDTDMVETVPRHRLITATLHIYLQAYTANISQTQAVSFVKTTAVVLGET